MTDGRSLPGLYVMTDDWPKLPNKIYTINTNIYIKQCTKISSIITSVPEEMFLIN